MVEFKNIRVNCPRDIGVIRSVPIRYSHNVVCSDGCEFSSGAQECNDCIKYLCHCSADDLISNPESRVLSPHS